MIEIAISCDMSKTFRQRMNSEPKQKRERFQQLTQNPKVKTGKVFAADLRKSKIHPTVKKLTVWRKLNRLSRPEAGKKGADRQIHILPPSSKNSCSIIRPLSVPKNEISSPPPVPTKVQL